MPDEIVVDSDLKSKLDAFMKEGGKLILSGTSGLRPEGGGFIWDIGAVHEGESPFQPDYIVATGASSPDFVHSPLVMYTVSQRIRVTDGVSLGAVHDPYFNRRYDHFSSHQHAPNLPEPSGYDCGVMHGNILYFAHPVFTLYRAYGAVAYRQYITNTIRAFLGDSLSVQTNLPGTARLHLNAQPSHNRHVLHVLYANTLLRGGTIEIRGSAKISTKPLEVVEELLPLYDTRFTLRLHKPVSHLTLEPGGVPQSFERDGDAISWTLDSFTCHQMVVVHHPLSR